MIKDEATSKRLHFDRKMIGILSLFTVLGVCMLIIILIISNTMSALRAYGSLQTHWTEKRKEAAFLLVEYLNDPSETLMNDFHESLEVIDASTKARIELFKKDTDQGVVREQLIAARANPHDVDDMIATFERFHSFPDFKRAIDAWIESDRLVNQMRALAGRAESQFSRNTSSFSRNRQQYIDRVKELDNQLTDTQYVLASALSDGTHLLSRIIFLISVSLGAILLGIGAVLTVRFLRSVREWGRMIEMSEQRYRSLYERNPNAVFSMDTEGHIIDENEAMKLMTQYSSGELAEMKAEQLVIPNQRENVRKMFEEVIKSKPQSFETTWIRVNGEKVPLYLTYLPIYVDDKIVGVFGIADDISYIKHMENQLKQQLEEKTLLLAEVHDRVKNNLALISSLLQLQEQTSIDDRTQQKLESTRARIHSMAMVHERLYHVESFSNIRMDEYVQKLNKSISKSYASEADDNHFNVIIDTEPVTLNIKRAIPCGLLLNELIVNAYKFVLTKDQNRQLEIRLRREKHDLFIQVKDDGKGLGDDFDINKQNSLGMILIRTLAKQLHGNLEFNCREGTEVNLRFRSEEKVLQSA